MPATINPIRKALVKQSLIQGKSIRQSLKDAGYSERTAHGHADKDFPVVSACNAEIQADIKKQITVESVLKGLCHIQDLALREKDFSTATRCEELKGKWLDMFTDKTSPSTVEAVIMQFSIDRLQLIQIQSPTT